jgi:acyl-CoA dehydrogenase
MSSVTCGNPDPRIAPISPQLILGFIAEKVLGLPKSY